MMVYLIDDKKSRQESDYLWTNERFGQFKNIIRCIYTLQELENESKEVFSNDNIILYHESFIDQTNKLKESIDKRNKLYAWSENKGNIMVYFSGSKNAREVNDNIAYIPVSTVYANLEIFLRKISINDTNLDYLIFGENINIEKELNSKQDVSLNETFKEEPSKLQGSILFLRPSRKYISAPFSQFDEKILFTDVSDEKLTEKINEWLNDVTYNYIFLPLCFGNILSDYNGLRLATHIRCTSSLNQLSRIYIYGFVGIEYLIQNEYFNILKSKNIFLILFSKNAFRKTEYILPIPYTIEELPEQIAKLKLDLPKNYDDSHSIANEWAIYRWSLAINTNDNDIEQIIKKVNNQLYFKYLSLIYPKENIKPIPEKELKIKYTGNPKILYIDDEADKGWYEIFCKILYDINSLEFEYLDQELNSKTQEEIIRISLDKIKDSDIDLVLLDFRLHPDDFNAKDIEDVTGLKLLKKIKAINPGIQVIVFSATNKVWNLLALQDAGADGFIVKESPENSQDINFTTQSIASFKNTIERCLKQCFIKGIFDLISPIANLVKNESEKKPSKFSLSIQQQIIQNINQRIEIFYKLIYNYPSNLEWPFSTLILIIEEVINTLYIDDGLDHFVEIDAFNKVKCNYILDSRRVLCLKPNYNANFTNERYVVPENEMNYYNKASNRDPFNFRLTCILHYRYLIPLGNGINKYFPLYKLRSNSVMHIGTTKVCVKDLELGIDLLKKIIK